jgi:hypothetical protein
VGRLVLLHQGGDCRIEASDRGVRAGLAGRSRPQSRLDDATTLLFTLIVAHLFTLDGRINGTKRAALPTGLAGVVL